MRESGTSPVASACWSGAHLALDRDPGPALAQELVDGSKHGVHELRGSEADRIVRRQAGLVLGGRDRCARLLLTNRARVERNRRNSRRTRRQREPLVRLDKLAQRRDRVRPSPAPSISVRPTSWQSTSRCGRLPW